MQSTFRAFTVEHDASTQYATIYEGETPVATIQRRRVYEKGPEWRLFTTKGREIVMPRYAGPRTALRMIAKVRELNPAL